jgi:ABC-2 type transport system ATP-binding protein
VTARGVVKRYGAYTALNGVDLDIAHGITGLLGANGAGKTTILGMLIGLHRADAGSITVLGHDPWAAGSKVRERLGYAPEHHQLPPDVRAADFVRHVAELHGLPKSEANTRASDALWLVGLGEERFRPMGTMSTGQRQRVKLAQAIAHDPDLILLDEPTDGLDPVQRDVMLNLIKSVAGEFSIDVILSSHLLDEVEAVCDNVTIIGDGETIASGALDDLRNPDSIGVVLDVDADEADAAQLAIGLEQQGFTVAVDGHRLIIEGDDEAVFDAARDACATAGFGISRLQRRRLTLEDVFLERLG